MNPFTPGSANGAGNTSLASLDGKFPAAAAAGDGESNATTETIVRSRGFGFGGSTWDRLRAGITTATATVTGWLNVIPGLIYSTSKPTLTNGQYSSFQGNVNGALDVDEVAMPGYENGTDGTAWTQPRALSTNTSGSITDGGDITLIKSTVLKASPGRLYSSSILVDSTATNGVYYVQLHNATSLPADTAVPARSFKVTMAGADTRLNISTIFGRFCSTGIVIALSTTKATLTIVPTAWMSVESFEVG